MNKCLWFQPPFNRLAYRMLVEGANIAEQLFAVNASTGAVTTTQSLALDTADFYYVSKANVAHFKIILISIGLRW